MENHSTKQNGVETQDPELKPPCLSMRWLLAFLGLGVNFLIFMVKNSFAVAIVSMVNMTSSGDESESLKDVCPQANSSASEDSSDEGGGDYTWTSAQQGQILGAYVLGIFAGRVLGGRAGERFGQRLIVTLALGIGGVLEVISPFAAELGPYALFVGRLLMGCVHGLAIPAFHSLMSKWAPRSQLASMLTTSFSGVALGSMVGLITAGVIADNLGWRWIFWSEGILTFIFLPFWIFLVRNSPEDHPYVTPHEHKILDANKNVVVKKEVPWKKIFTSPYVYVCIIGQFSRGWLDGVQNAEGPSFFTKKIGLDVSHASLVCGVTDLIALPSLLLYGRITDLIIRKKYLSRLTTRKIMHIIGTGGPCLVFTIISLADCNQNLVIGFWLILGIVYPASACSYNASIIDFAPNYAGTLMGILGIGNLGGFLSPIVTSAFATTENGWNKNFYVAAVVNLAACLLYLVCMTDQPQPWNFYEGKKKGSVAKATPVQTNDKLGYENKSFASSEHDATKF